MSAKSAPTKTTDLVKIHKAGACVFDNTASAFYCGPCSVFCQKPVAPVVDFAMKDHGASQILIQAADRA